MQIVVFIIFIIVALFLIATWPGPGRRERMETFIRCPIAHRGFHDNRGEAPENSMAAYRKAVERGYGIELDIRLSADGQLICMHDRNLLRATGVDVFADALPWSKLKELKLFSSEEGIPRFRDVLAMVDGRVPIIMEVKAETLAMAKATSREAAELLDSYEGPICMESFHPAAVGWFRKNRPQTLRGQLSEKFHGYPLYLRPGIFALSCCALNFLTRPDFIAYNVKQRSLLRFRLQHDVFHAVCAAWTVRSPEEMRLAASKFDIFIFEGFEAPRSLHEEGSGKTTEDTMGNPVRKYILVSGRVQAVGFRYRAVHIAQSLGITGFVRNREDQRVEMELQGSEASINEMMRLLKEQRFIEITDVELCDISPKANEYEFKVRYE